MEEQEEDRKNKTDEKGKEVKYDQLLLEGKDILPQLKQSISQQKKFISFIIDELKENNQTNDGDKEHNILKIIFSFIIKNSDELGIPFFSLLRDNVEFINIIINFFYDKKFTEEIKSLIKGIIKVFNFEFSDEEKKGIPKIPINKFFETLKTNGIINQNDLEEFEQNDSLTFEEHLYLNIEHISNSLKNENCKEKEDNFMEYLNHYDSQLNSEIEENGIDIANFEFFKEKIDELKNYKNKLKENFEKKDNSILDKNRKDEFNDFPGEKEEEISLQEKIIEEIKELRKKPLKDRLYLYKNEQIIEDENEFREYKDYFFPLRNNQQEELKRQICAFINSKGGIIYIGISDKKVVKGVMLVKEFSFYEKEIKYLTKNIFPEIKIDEYLTFNRIPIKDNSTGKIIENLIIMKIIIKKGDPSKLYSISSKGLQCSIRLQGQCANLTAEEIHKEILLRNNQVNNKKNDVIINKKIIDDNEKKKNDKKSKEIKENAIINNNNIEKNYNKDNNNKNNNINDNINDNKIINNNNKILDLAMFDEDFINENKDKEDVGSCSTKDSSKKGKRRKKPKNKKNKEMFRVNIYNIDKIVDEQTLKDLFSGFNCISMKFYQKQSDVSGYLDFTNENDADNCVKTFNGMNLGKKKVQLEKVSFNI